MSRGDVIFGSGHDVSPSGDSIVVSTKSLYGSNHAKNGSVDTIFASEDAIPARSQRRDATNARVYSRSGGVFREIHDG
jgi:hypothetical protein